MGCRADGAGEWRHHGVNGEFYDLFFRSLLHLAT